MNKLALRMIAGLLCAMLIASQVIAKQNEIAVIVKTVNSNFWQNVRNGAEHAEEQMQGKYRITFQGPEAETQISKQINMVEGAIQRGVSGIVLAPSDPNALVASVKKAWQHGIPVVLIDSQLNDAHQYYQSFLATDNHAAGILAAQKVIAALKGKKGKVAMMSYTPDTGSAIGRDSGFQETLQQAGYEIIGPFYSQAVMANAFQQTLKVLASHQDLVAIFASNEPTAVGMGRALSQQQRAAKLVAIGFDGNDVLQSFVKDGTLNGIVVQSSYAMGYEGVNSIVQFLAGKKLEKFIATGVLYVTKDNIESSEAQALLY